MRYLGGKGRIAKPIAKIINQYTEHMPFWEPFVGGANVVGLVKSRERNASDLCEPLIAMWKAVQRGWQPPESVSEEMYEAAKSLPNNNPLKAFIGFGCSFGALYFSSYAGFSKERKKKTIRVLSGSDIKIRYKKDRNAGAESKRFIEKKAPLIRDVNFVHKGYKEVLEELSGYFIYCDPPYANTTGYKAVGDFDSEEFWAVVAESSKRNIIMVSEYSAPPHIICIKSFDLRKFSSSGENNRVLDKLFIHPNNKNAFM